MLEVFTLNYVLTSTFLLIVSCLRRISSDISLVIGYKQVILNFLVITVYGDNCSDFHGSKSKNNFKKALQYAIIFEPKLVMALNEQQLKTGRPFKD